MREFINKCIRKKIYFLIPFAGLLLSMLIYGAAQIGLYKVSVKLQVEDPMGTYPGEKADRAFRKSLDINFDKASGLMEASLKGRKPENLANILNSTAEAYVRELSKKLEEERGRLLKIKEPEIREYKKSLEKELIRAREDLAKRELKMANFKTDDEKVTTRADGMKEKLAELERDRSRFLRVYTELHPDVIRIDAEISNLKEGLDSLPKRPAGGFELENTLKESKKRYAILKKKWDEVQFKKIEELVSPKKVPSISSYASKPQAVLDSKGSLRLFLIALLLAFLFGAASVSAGSFLDSSILLPKTLSSYTKLPVVGQIPYIEANALLLGQGQEDAAMEAYRRLYTRIQSDIFGAKADGRAVLITSSLPGEGKTVTAVNLALTIARAAKTVALIDCNMINPSIHKLFGIDPKLPGLTDILIKGASLESAILTVTDMLLGKGNIGMKTALGFKGLDRLSLITSGTPLSTAGELLRSDRIDSILSSLKAKFDCLILDSSSVSATVDSAILSTKCDATLLVYSAGRPATPRNAIKSSIAQLADLAKAKGKPSIIATSLKGVIMNRCT